MHFEKHTFRSGYDKRDVTMDVLTDATLVNISWWVRIIPSCYNKTIEQRVRSVLLRRNLQDVRREWECYPAGYRDAARAVVRTVEATFQWPSDRVIPQDQCRILFRVWEKGWCDDMSLELFLMDIDALFPSLDESMVERNWEKICQGTLGEFVAALYVASK